jgi:hypothetical protein
MLLMGYILFWPFWRSRWLCDASNYNLIDCWLIPTDNPSFLRGVLETVFRLLSQKLTVGDRLLPVDQHRFPGLRRAAFAGRLTLVYRLGRAAFTGRLRLVYRLEESGFCRSTYTGLPVFWLYFCHAMPCPRLCRVVASVKPLPLVVFKGA